jgi:hypothetical protein
MKENELEALKKKSLYSLEFSHEHKDTINAKKNIELISEIRKKILNKRDFSVLLLEKSL